MNLRSSGLVKHANRVIKSTLQCFAEASTHGHRWEVLGDIVCSFRVLPTRLLGYAPYILIFKVPAPLAIHHEELQSLDGINWETVEEDLA